MGPWRIIRAAGNALFGFVKDMWTVVRKPYRSNLDDQRLRCYATNRKVAGSIPDGVTGIFRWHNPSDRTMALGSTHPVKEMSTMADNLITSLRRCHEIWEP